MRPARTMAAAFLALTLTASAIPAAEKADTRVGTTARWLRIRVYEGDAKTPTVLVNVPFSLAKAALRFAAATGTLHARLNDGEVRIESGDRATIVRLGEAEKELADLIREIEALPPGQIVEVVDGGDRVSIWIE